MKMTITELKALSPCDEGLNYACQHKSLKSAWEKCERGDWLMWFLKRKSLLDKPTSVKLACAFASRVLAIYEKRKPGDLRPRQAVEAALKWVESPTEENRKAAAAAAAATYAAYAAAAVDAVAYAAAAATYAADAVAYDTADAAADAATYAADAATYAARKSEHKWQVEEIRRIIPNPFE